MSFNLHVANLSHTIRDDELRSLFAVHGTVRAAHVLDQLKTGISTASGVVEMDSQEGAEAAVAALNGQAYYGHALKVSWETARRESSRGRSRAVESADFLEAAGPDTCRGPRRGGFGDRGGHRPRGARFFVFAESDRYAAGSFGQRL